MMPIFEIKKKIAKATQLQLIAKKRLQVVAMVTWLLATFDVVARPTFYLQTEVKGKTPRINNCRSKFSS
jgi:hypothetical protein